MPLGRCRQADADATGATDVLPIHQSADVKRESDVFGVSVSHNPMMKWLNLGTISLCAVCEVSPGGGVGGIRVGMDDVR